LPNQLDRWKTLASAGAIDRPSITIKLKCDLVEAAGSDVWLGFLGSQASHAADANLVAQIVVFSLLLVGVYFGRAAKLKTHSRLMKSAIIVQFGALILWMGPSLLLNVRAFETFGVGPLTTTLHVLGGGLALALAIAAASHRAVVSAQLRWTMWTTFLVWTLAAILGIAFYVYYYLL